MDLSICIPIYNNKSLFQSCLITIANAVRGLEHRVEIVISDNASEDDIPGCIEMFKKKNPNISINYFRNETNRGMAYNFHKVVELSSGDFCWIIGSDDFIVKEGVTSILKVIDENPHLDFISIGYSLLALKDVHDSTNLSNPYHRIPEVINDSKKVKARKVNKPSGIVDKWDSLIDPAYDNVMMGAVMSGVFRRTRWLSVPVNIEELDNVSGFSNIENTYPHCAIYAKSMVGKPAYYLGSTVIIVGEGARDWMGSNFWKGYLPIIYLEILDEIVDSYKDGGLDETQLLKCRLYTAKLAGSYFIPYLYRRYFQRRYIKNQHHIYLLKIIKRYWRYKTFYSGMKNYINKQRKNNH